MRPSGCLSAGNKTAILKRHLDSEEGGRERRPIGRASAVVTRPLGAGGDGGAGRDEGKREGWRTASRASPRNEVPNGMQTQSRRKTGGWPPSSRLVQLAHAPLTVTHFIVPSTSEGGALIDLILQTRKQRHRERKELSQRRVWQARDGEFHRAVCFHDLGAGPLTTPTLDSRQ